MGRAPCCDKANVKRGPWSPEEDAKLKDYIEKHGTGGNWIALPSKAGLRRCGKSCRLRWLNYLRPNIRHGEFTDDEDRIICSLFSTIGSRWSIIAAQLPGRTDNDIKNYWNTKLKKKLLGMMTPSNQHQIRRSHLPYPLLPSNNNYNHSLMQNYSTPSAYSSINSHISALHESGNSNYFSTMAFSTLTSPSLLQDGCLGPTQVSYNQAKQSNFLVFGTEAASCSSSDGSQGRDQVEQDYGENLGQQCYFSNGADDTQKLLIGDSGGDLFGYGGDEKAVANGCYSENALDYSIEEIKQLISSNNVSCDFFVDEIKTEEKEIYY